MLIYSLDFTAGVGLCHVVVKFNVNLAQTALVCLRSERVYFPINNIYNTSQIINNIGQLPVRHTPISDGQHDNESLSSIG